MAIFGTFYHKLGNVWPQEYIADNGEVFYLRRRAGEQLVFIAAGCLPAANEFEKEILRFAQNDKTSFVIGSQQSTLWQLLNIPQLHKWIPTGMSTAPLSVQAGFCVSMP